MWGTAFLALFTASGNAAPPALMWLILYKHAVRKAKNGGLCPPPTPSTAHGPSRYLIPGQVLRVSTIFEEVPSRISANFLVAVRNTAHALKHVPGRFFQLRAWPWNYPESLSECPPGFYSVPVPQHSFFGHRFLGLRERKIIPLEYFKTGYYSILFWRLILPRNFIGADDACRT